MLAGGFAAAGLFAFTAARRSHVRDRRAWLIMGAILVLLGCAKLVRLQEDLTGALRGAAQASGLYGFHREAQAAFAVTVAMLTFVGAMLLARGLRQRPRALGLAVVALGSLLVTLVVRAASIHAIDLWTTAEFAGMRRGWWSEAIAAAVVAACAVAYRRSESS